MPDDDFYRIKRLPPYIIAEVNAMRAAARAGGEDIIDLGMGNPDLPPPPHVIDKLVEVARKPDAHGYSQSKGIPGLRRAQANYYGRRFGVDRRFGDGGGRDHGVEGGARQPRHRDHCAGRRRARAQSQLSDPHVRLHHRRRDDPRGADHPRRGVFRQPRTGDGVHCAAAVGAGGELSLEPYRRDRRSCLLRAAGRLGEASTGCGSSATWPIRNCISTASQPFRFSRSLAPRTIAIEFTSP